MKTITLRLEDEHHKALKHKAVDIGVSMQEIIVDLLSFSSLIIDDINADPMFKEAFHSYLKRKAAMNKENKSS